MHLFFLIFKRLICGFYVMVPSSWEPYGSLCEFLYEGNKSIWVFYRAAKELH
jgi:hypothetical protein